MTSRETDAAWNRTNSEGNIMTDITQAQHLKAAAQQALTVLRGCLEHPDAGDAISALQHAIAQPAKPEPIGYSTAMTAVLARLDAVELDSKLLDWLDRELACPLTLHDGRYLNLGDKGVRQVISEAMKGKL